MQSMAGHTLWQRNRLYRGMAIFLIIFAFVDLTIIDLAFPQLCDSDHSPMSSSLNAISLAYSTGESYAVASSEDDNDREQHSNQGGAEEDCFCCCSHIVPSVPVNIAALGLKPLAPLASNTSLPSPPPQSKYHPPRFS
jgi:hypothetical protein